MDHEARITEAEGRIIRLLWQEEPLTMPQITQALEGETGWTRHTVINLLKRMLAKGTVRVEKARPARLYYAVAKKEEVSRQQMRSLLDRFFDGKATRMVHAMVREGDMTGEEIDELMEMLRAAREEEEM